MQTKKCLMRWTGIAAVAFVTTLALGLDMSVALPKQLIVMQRDGLMGVMNNLLISLNHFHTMDHLTSTVVAIGCVWLYNQYLFRNERKMKAEYVLAGFLAATMLVSEALVAEDTSACLWAGGTQLLKAMLYVIGVGALFLSAIRAMAQGLEKAKKLPGLRHGSLWDRHPFAAPFLTMAICWLPIWIMKYPGGMSPDVTMQILDFQNQTMTLSHPPFTTVAYGLFYEFGLQLGYANLGIMLFTLLQTFALLGVLAYSCVKMHEWKTPSFIYTICLVIYCVSPAYSGYVTSLVKDIPYTIGCILLSVLMIDFSLAPRRFAIRKRNHVLLFLAGTTIWLWRRNGVAMVFVCGVVMMMVLLKQEWKKKNSRKVSRCFALTLAAIIAGSVGTNTVITACYTYGPAMQREVYSHLLQATGRVAVVHGESLSEQEKDIINRVMDYDEMVEDYNPIITDGVKFHFKEKASAEEYAAYRQLVWKHMKQYPQEYVDTFLNLTYRMFDLRSDRGKNVDRREISHPFYLRSYTNLLYNQQELSRLNAAQEMAENWHFWFPDLPLVGLLMNMGFCTDVLLAMTFMMFYSKKKKAVVGLLPAFMTVVFCLLSPIVYIRYALPLVATLPLWLAAWCAHEPVDDE